MFGMKYTKLTPELMQEIEEAKQQYDDACAEYDRVAQQRRTGEVGDEDFRQAFVAKQEAYASWQNVKISAQTLSDDG